MGDLGKLKVGQRYIFIADFLSVVPGLRLVLARRSRDPAIELSSGHVRYVRLCSVVVRIGSLDELKGPTRYINFQLPMEAA